MKFIHSGASSCQLLLVPGRIYSEYKSQKLNLALDTDWLSLEVSMYVFSWLCSKASVFKLTGVQPWSVVGLLQKHSVHWTHFRLFLFGLLFTQTKQCWHPLLWRKSAVKCVGHVQTPPQPTRKSWHTAGIKWTHCTLCLPHWDGFAWSRLVQKSFVLLHCAHTNSHALLLPISSQGLAPTRFSDIQFSWAK